MTNDSILNKDFFELYYNRNKLSFPAIHKMLKKQGINISISTIYSYAKKHKIGRSISEATRSLNYEQSFLNEDTIESIDGFLLGDGHISLSKNVARLSCGLQYQEFARYLMSFFCDYKPSVNSYKDVGMSAGIQWQGRTKFHPDLSIQYKRWYSDGGTKQPPADIRITPKSVLLWYLGDGSLVQGKNTVIIRLSTDGFDPDKVNFLAKKLNDVGIKCHRNGDNRIMINTRGVPDFFDFIGRESPIKCYSYKFDLPEWRFEAKRMKEVADELDVSYNRLSHLVKTGVIKCYRASEKGRPRMLKEHIEKAVELKKKGILY